MPEATPSLSSLNLTSPTRKRRAAAACTACHARKVRCNVVSSGRPCANCQQDQNECVLHVSARGKHKRPRCNQTDGPLRTDAHSVLARSPSTLSGAPESLTDVSLMGAPPSFSANPQLVTPSDHPSTEAEEFESNVAGYKNIVEHTVGGRGLETHIYVGRK